MTRRIIRVAIGLAGLSVFMSSLAFASASPAETVAQGSVSRALTVHIDGNTWSVGPLPVHRDGNGWSVGPMPIHLNGNTWSVGPQPVQLDGNGWSVAPAP